MRRALCAALVAGVLVVSGCSSQDVSFPTPGAAKVDVDTPELRTIKEAAGVEDCVPGTGAQVAGGLPDVTLPCLGGGLNVNLSSLRGPMIVSLWASWCGPCRDEMPLFEEFSQEYGDQVPVLGINYQDAQPLAALELAQDTGVTYPLLADPQSDLDRSAPFPHLGGLPFLALVDADGRVVHQEFIEIKSTDQLVDLVSEHLGVGL